MKAWQMTPLEIKRSLVYRQGKRAAEDGKLKNHPFPEGDSRVWAWLAGYSDHQITTKAQ